MVDEETAKFVNGIPTLFEIVKNGNSKIVRELIKGGFVILLMTILQFIVYGGVLTLPLLFIKTFVNNYTIVVMFIATMVIVAYGSWLVFKNNRKKILDFTNNAIDGGLESNIIRCIQNNPILNFIMKPSLSLFCIYKKDKELLEESNRIESMYTDFSHNIFYKMAEVAKADALEKTTPVNEFSEEISKYGYETFISMVKEFSSTREDNFDTAK